MQWTVWRCIPGDMIFAIGVLMLVVSLVRAIYGIFQQPTQAQPDDIPSGVIPSTGFKKTEKFLTIKFTSIEGNFTITYNPTHPDTGGFFTQ